MTNLKDKVAKNIATIIDLSGYRKAEVARLLGVSRSAITNWTRGDNIPDIEMIAQMSVLFDVPLSAILGAEASTAMSPQEHALITAFRKLNTAGKQKVLDTADDLAEIERYTNA